MRRKKLTMAAAADALRDDTETVVLASCGTADAAEKTLLNAALELDNSDAGRRGGDLNRDLANREPREENATKSNLATVCCVGSKALTER